MPTTSFTLDTLSSRATQELAGTCARVLPEGAVVALIGDLGSGKTRFVRGFVGAFGLNAAAVSSPTFTFVNEYRIGGRTIAHMDLYRIDRAGDLINFSPGEYFDLAAFTLIEWADRIGPLLPADALRIEFTIRGPQERSLRFTAPESPWMERLRRELLP